MWIQQVFVACVCILLALQQITAVVNNGQKTTVEVVANNDTTINGKPANNSITNNGSTIKNNDVSSVTDSIASSSEIESTRREAPLGLSDSYGAPLPLQDSYIPPIASNIGLPIPVYGVPDSSSANLIYPAPPPDIPPPIQVPLNTYGPPVSLPSPPIKYGQPAISSRPLTQFNYPKPIYGPPVSYGPPPRPQYGPPQKLIYIPPKLPKPSYGPPLKYPKPFYGPPKLPPYIPQKPSGPYGPPIGYLNSPKDLYSPPKNTYGPSKIPHGHPPSVQYGPPQPIPHGPPHPGVPAPPTPPDIKYDGWQPIPGLVSRPPSGSYGVPKGPALGLADTQFNTDLIPPPSGDHGSHGGHGDGLGGNIDLLGSLAGLGQDLGGHGGGHVGYSSGLGGGLGGHSGSFGGHGGSFGGHGGSFGGHGGSFGGHSGGFGGHGSGHGGGLESYKDSSGLSDSYGAPLNTVTGSGGVISSSGDAHVQQGGGHHGGDISIGLSSLGISGTDHGSNGLSVIKSIEYQLFPNSGRLVGDSYSLPPLNSYSPNGPYAASHSYKANDISLPQIDTFASSLASSFDTTLLGGSSHGFGQDLSLGIGLIPPSKVYGLPPSGKYGTPLLQADKQPSGLNQPKHPVIFRDPVPPGLIQSIGNSVAQKDAQGVIESAHSNYEGSAYIPPPVSEITKPVKEQEPTAPLDLYSLPNKNPSSFQNYAQGLPTAGLSHDFSGSLNIHGASAAALTSYTAALGTVDGSYGLPQNSGGLTAPHAAASNAVPNYNTGSFNSFGSSTSTGYTPPYFATYQNGGGYNCSQNSQPLPSLSFGVPAANSYTASLASLNTNLAGAYQGPAPALSYGAPDLQAAHSQSTGSISGPNSNSLEESAGEKTGKSVAANFGTDTELVKSQSIDLNNIPLQGALGSYTLQIQSADGIGGSNGVSHDQVLNEGLLQSILNAIEQPQQNTAAILGQPLLHLQQVPPQTTDVKPILSSGGGEEIYGAPQDSEAQNSLTKNIVVTPPPLQTTSVSSVNSKLTKETDVKDENVHLIDNNEIALYFNNNLPIINNNENLDDQSKDIYDNSVKNAQQYGSYVAFRSANSSYTYGDAEKINSALDENGTKTKTDT